MASPVCPWCLGYFLLGPLRRLLQGPAQAIVGPHVRPGMTVLEPGPGMGFFTLELARLVGPQGKVIAVDLQPRMLESLRKRAQKAQLLDRIELRLARKDSLGIDDLAGKVDFALLFAVVHEVDDPAAFLGQVARALGEGKRALLSEPRGHVRATAFDETLKLAEGAALRTESRPEIRRSRSAILVRG